MIKTFIRSMIIVLLSLNVFPGYGQNIDPPAYYLNGVKIDFKNYYINPKNVDSVRVIKKTGTGEIFIKTKKINFITIDDILKMHPDVVHSEGNALFRIDGKIIDDASVVRVDDTYRVYLVTGKLSEIKYLKAKYRDLVIVDIYINKEPEIMLRGKDEILQADKLLKNK